MKWSYLTSKEEIIYLIKVFPSKSFSQSELKCQRKIELIKRTLQGPPGRSNAEGDGRMGTKEGGGERDIANPLHRICVEWPLSLAFLCPPAHNQPPSQAHVYTDTSTQGEPDLQEGFRGGSCFPDFVFVAL